MSEIIAVNLPADCIYEIIQYVINDIKTLHSCIVLNQNYCQVAVRILWRNPFKYIKQDEKKRGLIFRTYFSCLDDQEKKQITSFFHKPDFDFPKPFINYPSFLQEFEIFNIQTSMRSFLYQYYSTSTSPTENRINSIVHILNPFMEKLFFNNQSNFRYLNINLDDERNQIDLSSFDDKILEYVLSNINKFTFRFGFRFDVKKLEILKFIQKNATKLTEIISNHNKNIKHVQLIFTKKEFKQQKLKKLNPEFNKLLDILNSFIISLDNLKSLEMPCFMKDKNFAKKHSHSLTHLKLHEIRNFNIIINILDHCSNLESIELSSFYCNKNTDISALNNPIKSKLNNLKYFHITISYLPVLNLFKRIILMSNNDLRTLYYDKYITNSRILNITKLIRPFCTNITHLFIRIFQKELCAIISFLKSLKFLIFLKLDWDNYLKISQISELAHSFSSSLQILEILEIDSPRINGMLGALFQNMQCQLKEFSICMDIYINDDLLKIIIDYVRRKNSLKIFRYSNLPLYRHYRYQLSKDVLEEARNLFTIDDNPEPFKRTFIESIF